MIPRIGTAPHLSAWGEALWWHHEATTGDRLQVTNRLVGDSHDAETMRRLLDDGALAWTFERRSPNTAFSETDTTSKSSYTVESGAWAENYGRARFLVCGLAAARRVSVPLRNLRSIYPWRRLEVEPGRWLCHSVQVHEVETPARSLLSFVSDPDLPLGRMRIKRVGPLRYQVSLRPDVRTQIGERRDLRMAALVGAVSMLREEAIRNVKRSDDGSEDGGAEAGEEWAYLSRRDIRVDPDDVFDALEAATRIENVLELPTRNDADDE